MKTILPLVFMLAMTGVASACPDNWFAIEDVGMLSTLPAATVGQEQNGTPVPVEWNADQPCGGMCYDLPHGRLEVLGSNYLYGHETNRVSTSDEFVIEGPGTTPLQFEAVLVLDAEITVEGYAWALMAVDGFGERQMTLDATGQQIAAIPVSFAPGTKFRVDAGVYAEGGHSDGSGRSRATIRFRGLPPEYSISSCQGYALETPAHPTSWGGVKALYR